MLYLILLQYPKSIQRHYEVLSNLVADTMTLFIGRRDRISGEHYIWHAIQSICPSGLSKLNVLNYFDPPPIFQICGHILSK